MIASILRALRSCVVLLLLLCISSLLHAQDTAYRQRDRDTGTFSLFGDERDHASVDYVHSIEKAYETLNRVQNEAGLGFGIQSIASGVAEKDSALKMMRQAVRSRNNNISIRNLQLYRQIVLDIQDAVTRDRKMLDATNTRLESLEASMRKLTGDAELARLMRDSAAFQAQRRKLRRLQGKWQRADSLLQSSFDTLAVIRSEAADDAIAAAELTTRIGNRLRKNSFAAMGKECSYLWEPDSSATIPNDAATSRDIRTNARKVMRYYMAQRQGKILLFLLCLGAFYWWVSRSYRNLRRNAAAGDFLQRNLQYLHEGRLDAAIVVLCSLLPFFDIYAPSSFTECVHLIGLVAVSVIFRKQWPARLFIIWAGLVLLFACYFLISGADVTLALRYGLILLNITSVVLALLFMRRLQGELTMQRLIKTAAVAHIVLNLLALASNAYGRVTIAQTLRNAGIYGLTQMVMLTACYELLQEAVLLQIQSSRLRRGIVRPFDTAQVTRSLRIPLLITIGLLWLTMFAVNINLYMPVKTALGAQLSAPVSIGSAAFTPGSVLLFFIIIWMAHLLQRYTGYIFGDIGFEDDEAESNKEQRSRMLISKLIILTIGYFLAIAASGLPVDKITIVLGALGVGIGLGLQNIVSNFISGIVLIFDRPLQIGDTIELGGKTGKVKEIGMRSSTLLTPEGAEVIIPNGDILSQQITNWTLSNNYRRLELNLTLKTERSKEEVLPLITGIVQSSSLVYEGREPLALIESMKDGEMGIRLFFWCSDLYKAEQVKSELRYLLYTKLREQDIKMG